MAATSFQQVTAMLVELNPQIFKKEVFCISSKGFNPVSYTHLTLPTIA